MEAALITAAGSLIANGIKLALDLYQQAGLSREEALAKLVAETRAAVGVQDAALDGLDALIDRLSNG